MSDVAWSYIWQCAKQDWSKGVVPNLQDLFEQSLAVHEGDLPPEMGSDKLEFMGEMIPIDLNSLPWRLVINTLSIPSNKYDLPYLIVLIENRQGGE